MAWTPEGSLGTASIKTAGAPLTWSPSRDVDAGQVVILWVATDSVYNIGNPHNKLDERWACHDDAGNIWTTLAAGTDADGFFKVGAANIIFISQLRNGLQTTDTVTITNQAEANIDAKALSAEEFTIGPNTHWAVADNNTGPVQTGTDAGDPPSIGMGNLPAREYMFLHCLGVEGPNTDSYTWDANWTQVAGAGTTGGVDDSNVHVRGGYRILTGTGVTINITSDTADRDNTQSLVAICEVPDVPFPNTPILDNFNRAAEYPLDNDIWNMTQTSGPSSPGAPRFGGSDGDEATGGDTGAGGSKLLASYVDCVEVYATMTVASTADADGWDLVFHHTGTTQNSTAGGHACTWRTQEFGENIKDYIALGKASFSGGVGSMYTRSWKEMVAPAKLGVQFTRGVLADTWVSRLWIDVGDGWEQLAAIQWNPAETSLALSGSIGFGLWDAITRLDDFGGGQIRCSFGRFVPKLIRRPPEGPFA